MGLWSDLIHELVIALFIDSLVVEHADLHYLVLALLILPETNLEWTEWLSLVPQLIYYAVQSGQVRRRLHILKDLLLSHLFIDLSKVFHFEYSSDHFGVGINSHENYNMLGIITQVDLVDLQVSSLQHFKLRTK